MIEKQAIKLMLNKELISPENIVGETTPLYCV